MTVSKWMNSLLLDAATLFLGIALTFAFAPYQIYPLAIIVPAILLGLWLKMPPESLRRAFWTGFLFGMGFFGAGVYWVYISVHEFGEVPTPLALLITGGMIAILSSYTGLLGYFLNRYFPLNNTAKILCAFPAIWVALEWARSLLLSGFAWLIIGYSQTTSPLRGFAPILSVYGVSLATIVTSALLVAIVLAFRQKQYKLMNAYLALGLAIWVGGELLSLIPWTKPDKDPVSVALVQGAIPQQLKWSSKNLMLSVRRYEEMTRPLWGKKQIIIWPETAIPMTLQEASLLINALDYRASLTKTTLILGVPIYAPESNGYRNAIVTLGAYKNVYSKRHLVPFGEYVPFSRWLFPMLNFMNIPTSDVIPGNYDQPPLTLGGLKISPSICYEITFPQLIHTFDPSIGFLLTLTNDAWFGKSNAQAQHLQMAAMRALELQRPVIIVSNDGITAIIGADGKILSSIPPYQPHVLEGQVQAMHGLTPWMRNGIDPVLFILIVLIASAVLKTRSALNSQKIGHATFED